MVLILLAKIIKNGWLDLMDAKNTDHRGIVQKIVENSIVNVRKEQLAPSKFFVFF